MKRKEEIQKVVDDLVKVLFGISNKEGIEEGICINCRQPALENCYSEAGKKEFYISGLCEKCFDGFCD